MFSKKKKKKRDRKKCIYTSNENNGSTNTRKVARRVSVFFSRRTKKKGDIQTKKEIRIVIGIFIYTHRCPLTVGEISGKTRIKAVTLHGRRIRTTVITIKKRKKRVTTLCLK